MIDRISIRELRDGDSIPSITKLLHAAYAPLAKQGFRYTATHQDDAMTLRRLRFGYAYVADLDGEIVGSITLRGSQTNSPCAWYLRPEVYSFGQFAVRPDLQGRGLGSRLLDIVERRAAELGAVEIALDTAEGAEGLRRWYARRGYRFIEFVSFADTNYRSVILSKCCTPSAR